MRSYALLQGGLSDLEAWEGLVGGLQVAPAFVWPADRRWCFASDVDPHWAGVGGEDAAVDALLRTPGLDTVRADPTAPQPGF